MKVVIKIHPFLCLVPAKNAKFRMLGLVHGVEASSRETFFECKYLTL